MITGWGGLIAAFVAFFVSHSVPVRTPVKPWLVARLGARGFTASYSILSMVMLGWLIVSVGNAPYIPLWFWSPWQNYITLVVMLLVCVIICFSIAAPNPFSFGGARNNTFDPVRPGIVRWTRHPLLIALALWAGSHLLVNGDLAHVILFGVFAAFAMLGGRMVDRRKRRAMGDEWALLRDKTSKAPLVRLSCTVETGARVGLSLVLYLGFIALHPHLFGVSPIP